MYFIYVCMLCMYMFVVYVSLFSIQNKERTGERICTKFSGNVRIVKGKNRVDFGDDWLPPTNSV